eukprot:gene12548-16827_t
MLILSSSNNTADSASSSTLSWILFGTKVVGGLILSVLALLYFNQDRLLYIPNPPGFPKTPAENPESMRSPADWTITGEQVQTVNNKEERIPYEEHFIQTSDGQSIHVWLLLQKHDTENTPTLIYFHGNAGNMGFRLMNAVEMFVKVKINILMMDYRGYGSSSGTPSEAGLNIDAQAVLQFAMKHPKLVNSQLVCFGRSLGGAVSVSLAHKFPNNVSGIILENTFLSISEMVDVLMPQLSPLKSLILKIGWHSDEKVKSLEQPMLFISGDSDELVPPSHMKKLYDAASNSIYKEFYSVSGGKHNDTWHRAGKDYYKTMKRYFDDYIRKNSLLTEKCDNDIEEKVKTSEIINNDGIEVEPSKIIVGDSENIANDVNLDDEDEDYDMIPRDLKMSLPTMGRDFQVK